MRTGNCKPAELVAVIATTVAALEESSPRGELVPLWGSDLSKEAIVGLITATSRKVAIWTGRIGVSGGVCSVIDTGLPVSGHRESNPGSHGHNAVF